MGVAAAPIAKGCLKALQADKPDLIIVELGDGLLGSYGVREILADPAIRKLRGTLVIAATDPVAAWGGNELLSQTGWHPSVITGPATDNSSGVDRIEELCSLRAINARKDPAVFAGAILESIDGPILGSIARRASTAQGRSARAAGLSS